MEVTDRGDIARQAANVVGALFQILGGLLLPIAAITEENASTLIDPAGYAFAIWGPIFLLCLAYAVYQALPANRRSPLLRRVGWFSAGAFLLDGLWEVIVPARQFLLAQVVLVGILLCAGVAYLRLTRSERGVLSGTERWLVALPLGLLFGWITAANAVSLTSEAARLGLVDGEGAGGVLLGSALLLLGGLLASAVILAGKGGPPQGYLAYAGAVLWALAGVVANQYDASILTTATAVFSAALVVLALAAYVFFGKSLVGWRRAVR